MWSGKTCTVLKGICSRVTVQSFRVSLRGVIVQDSGECEADD